MTQMAHHPEPFVLDPLTLDDLLGTSRFACSSRANRRTGKPMGSIGSGVEEIRIRTRLEHRVIYVARFAEGVYVLHAFEKRGAKTPEKDLAVARKRFREILARRKRMEHVKERT